MKAFETYQAQFIEDQYERWRGNSQSVSPDWQHFFLGFDMGRETPAGEEGRWDEGRMLQQARVEALKYRFREVGHLLACLEPPPLSGRASAAQPFRGRPDGMKTWTRYFTPALSPRRAPLKELITVPEGDLLPGHRGGIYASAESGRTPLAAGAHGTETQPAGSVGPGAQAHS